MAKPIITSNTPFSKFIYKAISISIIIALINLLSSSHETSTNSFFSQCMELLQLLIVGIAISYGLFGQINADQDIEDVNHLIPDSPQSYVSQVLQVSPPFNDDEEINSPKRVEFTDDNESESWNFSQYCREKPMVLVAKENSNSILRNARWKSFDECTFLSNENNEATEEVVLQSPIPWISRSEKKIYVKKHCKSLDNLKTRSLSERFHVKEKEPEVFHHSPSTPDLRNDLNTLKTQSFHYPSFPAFHENKNEDLEEKVEKPVANHECVDQSSDLGSYKERSSKTSEAKNSQPAGSTKKKMKKTDEFMQKMIITSDSESDESECSDTEEESNSESVEKEEEEREKYEVDKKADEFITKFREQIRLQRIASVRKSRGRTAAIMSK